MQAVNWSAYDVVINAAAWTNVDGAETEQGRPLAWKANAIGPANLARAAAQHGLTLVHISSEYTFDGSIEPHTEDEPPSPLGVYGQSKAGGDAAVQAGATALPGAHQLGGGRRQELRQDHGLPG